MSHMVQLAQLMPRVSDGRNRPPLDGMPGRREVETLNMVDDHSRTENQRNGPWSMVSWSIATHARRWLTDEARCAPIETVNQVEFPRPAGRFSTPHV